MTETEYSQEKKAYHASTTRKILFLATSAVVLLIVTLLSCSVSTGCTLTETFSIIFDHIKGVEYPVRTEMWWNDYYITQNIMPGICMALIAGAGLALAGAVMQNVMNNPLADSYTTGISSGASLGAVVALVLGFTVNSTSGMMGIVGNAFIGALIPCFILVLLVKHIGNSPATLILIGTALSFFFSSLVSLILVTGDGGDLQDAFLWTVGSVTRANWTDLPVMAALVVVSVILVQLVTRKMNVLALGETTAKSLGMDVSHFRTLCLILISILVASIIAFTGVIGFIGLVSPHIARFVLGGDNKFVVPGSIVMGAMILVIADMISRSLYAYGNVPVGVVMSFIGAPIFLYLIIRQKSNQEVF